MNVIANLPVSSRVKVMIKGSKVYEGTVSSHLFPDKFPIIVIEQCNRQQISFLYFEKLKGGEKGWALVPYPLPHDYAVGQDAMLHDIERVN